MRCLDLLGLSHQQARELADRVSGAAEITATQAAGQVSIEGERILGLSEAEKQAERLYQELVSAKILDSESAGIKSRFIRNSVELEIEYCRGIDFHEGETKLRQLLEVLPKYPKAAGKALRFRRARGVVYLVIHTGVREYTFLFPLQFFEAE